MLVIYFYFRCEISKNIRNKYGSFAQIEEKQMQTFALVFLDWHYSWFLISFISFP